MKTLKEIRLLHYNELYDLCLEYGIECFNKSNKIVFKLYNSYIIFYSNINKGIGYFNHEPVYLYK